MLVERMFEHLYQLGMNDLKVQPVRQNQYVLQKSTGFTLLIHSTDHLWNVAGYLGFIRVDIVGPQVLNKCVAEKIVPQSFRILSENQTERLP